MFGFLTDCFVGTINNGAPCDTFPNHNDWPHHSSPPMFAQPWEPMGATHFGSHPTSYDPSNGLFDSMPSAAPMPVQDWNR